MQSGLSRADLRARIPSECFRPSTLRSSAYLAFDLALLGVIAAALWWLPAWPAPAAWLALPLLFLAGTLCWALFVLGHEAGHGAFSPSAG